MQGTFCNNLLGCGCGVKKFLFRLRTLFDNSFFINQRKSDLFEEDTTSTNLIEPHCTWKDTWENFKKVFLGSGHIVARSSNLLHVLGSVTVRSCLIHF